VCERREGRSETGAETFERGQKVRNLIGVTAVSLVAIFGAALVPVSAAGGANATSNDFAGYQATSHSAFTSASVKFVVPAVQCPTSDFPSNLFGSFVNDLFGSGEAAVLINCSTSNPGQLTYLGFIGKATTSFAPRPGDLVKTTVSMSRTANVATLSDLTQGLSESSSFAASPGPAIAYDGVSTALCVLRCFVSDVFNFGKLRMFDAKLNGVTPRTAGATAVNMQKPPLEVATSALNTTGNAWTLRVPA
jgi:hypothetical protein